jgi:hypothetical protein
MARRIRAATLPLASPMQFTLGRASIRGIISPLAAYR